MSAAQSVLEELEAIGVLGSKSFVREVPPPPASSAPAPVARVTSPKDDIRLQVMAHCERAVDLLETSIEAQMALREVFVSLHGLCDQGSMEDTESGEEDESEDDAPTETLVSPETKESVEPPVEEEEQLPQTDLLQVLPPPVPLVEEEREDEGPLIKESKLSDFDTGSAVQDLIAQNDLAYRRETRSASPIAGSETPLIPPRSIDSALSTVDMPPARRAFLAEMKAAAEGKPIKRRAE